MEGRSDLMRRLSRELISALRLLFEAQRSGKIGRLHRA
jgi:hypothetical protein